MNGAVLLVGGAGFVGSAVAQELLQRGFGVVVLDLFLHGQSFDVPGVEVVRGDFGDQALLPTLFAAYRITAVLHFAAFIEVGRSVHEPAAFYENNVINTKRLLDAMQQAGIAHLVFSSSCAIYAPLERLELLTEEHPIAPHSPYGKTKAVVEYLLQDYALAYGLRYASLRYFNAAGALPEYGLGEQHVPESHVIPLLLRAADSGTTFTVFGNTYPTTDGTCVRDYVHVRDLAVAHRLALERLLSGAQSFACNLGSGKGYSVRQLIAAAARVCGKPVHVVTASPRIGDVPLLVADTTRAQQLLGWQAHATLDEILSDAWAFFQKKQLKNTLSAVNVENS